MTLEMDLRPNARPVRLVAAILVAAAISICAAPAQNYPGCLLSIVSAALTAPAAAQSNFPWCANFADGAGVNCGFSSYEQCMATARGSGGACSENDMYTGPKGAGANTAAPAQRQARKHHGKNS